MASVLVDTNVLVYAHDPSEGVKQVRAIEVLAALKKTKTKCFSAQNLSEFFWVATRGRRPLLTAAQAALQVERLAASWPVVDVTALAVMEAAGAVKAHGFSYWDALIWATARLSRVPIVLSEDFSNGRRIGGVRFVNPFLPAFEIDSLLS